MQGHFQIFLSKFNPLCQRGLSLGMRVLYASSVYTYLVSVLATLTLTAIPLINLWLGWFPLQINEAFIVSFVVYLFSGTAFCAPVDSSCHCEMPIECLH